ncbi:hypothetical protein [Fulvivirga sedimenti]|uniref:Uncharacterized protein n=1 Tax=Fulvivirga sedimenti TaxID=2879465 RepID=A0A9X1HUU4_9BACT|nr:hypothetical protein [Fulvivirga sedimenti]MCA6078688.1 hypothetical protein [Fulvivirga sedimenti]
MLANKILTDRQLLGIQVAFSLIFCCLPLFITFPYKINLYLAWEGAFRMSEGQVPFRDFGMPLGYGFWIIPALFFKIFGPFMSSLIKAQVLINLLSILALNLLWKNIGVSQVTRTIGTVIFCLTYVFIHFWPWYNHTVYVYEWISLAFLVASFRSVGIKKIIWAGLAGMFGFLSVFTKQDIGALGVFLAIAVIATDFYFSRDFKTGLVYLSSVVLFGLLLIWPLTEYEFGYWYNYGQDPHSTRISGMDYFDEIFSEVNLIYRLYFIAMIGAMFCLLSRTMSREKSREYAILFILTIGSLTQSILAGVTSYVPLNAHFYFHTFFIVFVLQIIQDFYVNLSRKYYLAMMIILVGFVWSQDAWKYSKRILQRTFPSAANTGDVVNKHTYILKTDTVKSDRSDWITSGFASLKQVTMPKETVEGFGWIVEQYGDNASLRLLNMSELPQLYYELGITPDSGADFPLWFHRNVSVFEREQLKLCSAIQNQEYDIVLFEIIPNLNDFYPPAVRECLMTEYNLVKTFMAPRIPEFSTIEVYERKQK